MKKKVNEAVARINAAGSKAVSALKAAPAHIANFLKRQDTQRAILTVLIFVLIAIFGLVLVALLILWLIEQFAKALSIVINEYGVYLLVAFIIICSILEAINKRRFAAEERRQKELEYLNQQNSVIYGYLRDFLFGILSVNFCTITGLCKPESSYNLRCVPAFKIESRELTFYYFLCEKATFEPLKIEINRFRKQLQSAITQEVQKEGISNITAAVIDPDCSVVDVHEVRDIGRNIRITLVFHTEAYRKLMERSEGLPPSSADLVEHLR